jgi:AraC-like DNA-binding protein
LAVQHRVVPSAPLSTFVALLWSYEGDTPGQGKERRLPDGAMGLVINLRDDLTHIYDRQQPDHFQIYRGSVISGAHSAFTILDSTGPACMLGAEFRPGGALPFLGLPAAALHNQVLSLEAIWGAAAQRLRDDLLAATTPTRRFALLEAALLARLNPARVAHPAVGFALAALHSAPHAPTMAAVTERIGLSQTRFIQVFREAVGLTPKQYCRVRRFQHVLRMLEGGAPVKWAELALTSGYFDQAHLIHDFQAFAGLTPTAYLTLRGDERNHIALVE